MDRFSEVDRSATNAREEIRCIAFNPDAECLYAISSKTFSVHQWEPYERLELFPMAWETPTALGFYKDDLLVACVSGPQMSLYSISVKSLKPFAPEEESNSNLNSNSVLNPILNSNSILNTNSNSPLKAESIPSAPVQVQMRAQQGQKLSSPLKKVTANKSRRSFAEKKEKDSNSVLKMEDNSININNNNNKPAYQPPRFQVENNYSAVFQPNRTSTNKICINLIYSVK